MIPEPLKLQFWMDVSNAVVRRHEIPTQEATNAIASFRVWVKDNDLCEQIYSQDAETVADVVVADWKCHQNQPEPVG